MRSKIKPEYRNLLVIGARSGIALNRLRKLAGRTETPAHLDRWAGRHRLLAIIRVTAVAESAGREENVVFALPRELR